MLASETLVHGRYRILRLIGRGGMGAVYEAIDERLGNRVALKQTLIREPELDRAFEREARLLAALRHPCLPVVSDYFADSAGQFLVMQYIAGEDLGTLLTDNGEPFEVAQVMDWADQLLATLHYLHSQHPPIIHRDIKPQNLKQTTTGELVLLDFGLAKASRQPNQTTSTLLPTEPSLHAYTLQYAPLEQIEGHGTDARSDLYSLSVTMYHLMTGVAPASALARAGAVVARRPDPLRPAHEVNPQISAAMSAVLARGVALHAGDRPASAADLRRMLREATGAEGVGLKDEQTRARPVRSPAYGRARWRAVLVIGLVLATLVLAMPFVQSGLAERSGTLELTNNQIPSVGSTVKSAVTDAPISAATATNDGEGITPRSTTVTEPELNYQELSLADYATSPLEFESPPTGSQRFADVPFNLTGRAFKTQSSFAPYDTAPVSLALRLDVPEAYRLHLLLNTGNGFTLFNRKVIGEVRATCSGSSVVVAQLQLGQDVREWHNAPKLVTGAERAREVWSGQRTDAPDRVGHIDLLSLDLPPPCREGRLSAIEIADVSTDTVNSLDPALNLVGLTIEHYRP